ncbi:MAG: alanine dehydrogenase [bacterium]
MVIGVPRELKDKEYRVGVVPAGVSALVRSGNRVLVERGAGVESGFSDEDYRGAGAAVVDSPEEIYGESDMVMKVKEPLPREFDLLREGQILYTYLHLAASPEVAKVLLEKGVVGIAYETIQLDDGRLPLLIPMSEVAGKMAVQIGAHYLEKENGGRGILLGGVPGVLGGQVVIIGAGVVGFNAARIACGMGARVFVLDRNMARLRYIEDVFGSAVSTVASNEYTIAAMAERADLLIGAVLIPGAKTPKLVTEEMVKRMKAGSVIIDVSVDQGGCVETSRVTTHTDPTFVKYGVIHYGVTNIPGAVPRTSTLALANVTIEYALSIARWGWEEAARRDGALARGINTVYGKVVHPAVAESLGYPYHPLQDILADLP